MKNILACVLLAFSSLSSPRSHSTPQYLEHDCSEFQEASCHLNADNIVEIDRHQGDVAICQSRCLSLTDCHYFTHYGTSCYLVKDCSDRDTCPGCISGPQSPPIFTTCPWPPHPTTVITTAWPSHPTTTTATTTDSSSCGVFQKAYCDLTEYNVIKYIHESPLGHCQDLCSGEDGCEYFTWYETPTEHFHHCWLLSHCDTLLACQSCISGPRFPDVDTCPVTNELEY